MTDSVQEQLLGHLLGALDDLEQEAVEVRLKSDPELQRELARIGRRLEPLQIARRGFVPPPGLARRTCRMVAAEERRRSRLPEADILGSRGLPSDSPKAAVPRSRAVIESPSWVGRIRWLDVAMAATVFLAAALLTIPALQNSRYNSRLIACQNNLREIGQAMKQYALGNGGYFPRIPPKGRLATAGIYAPMLQEKGLLTDDRWLVCPGSSLADRKRFRVPSPAELRSASPEEYVELRKWMGGSYGNHLGHFRDGVYQNTKDLNRTYFVIMADAPNTIIPGYQSDNHSGRGQNVLFEDGRVRFLSTSRLSPEADDFFYNDDGEVAAGKHENDSVIGSSSAMPIIWVKGGN